MKGSWVLAGLLGAVSVLADGGIKCDLDKKCPESAPCCSQFGQCGVGAFCLGGCDPRMSHSLDSCVPEPVCKDSTTKFNDKKSIVDVSDYLGDPSDGTWVSNGQVLQMGDSVLLTMPKDSSGTLLSSTTYMWYGNVKARMKTSRGRGVITAFIMFSDVKDEIDYEFVGADLSTAQTNYYFQGILDWHNSANISDLSDTFENFHDYEVRWTPDKIEWAVDGKVGRTQERSKTWNETTQNYDFPQTPARVQLSLWPGGKSTNAPGTIAWAGGQIDWDSEDIQKAGYYYATVESVTIECYNAKSAPGTNKNKSYYYNSLDSTNNTVVDSDKDTVLASFEATGLDMDAGKKKGDSTSSPAAPSSTADQIPGQGGATGQDHSGESTNQSGGTDGGSGASGLNPQNCDPTSFNLDCSSGSSSSSSSSSSGSTSDSSNNGKSGSSKTGASALAIIIAGAALFML